jgi:hypothetical protein
MAGPIEEGRTVNPPPGSLIKTRTPTVRSGLVAEWASDFTLRIVVRSYRLLTDTMAALCAFGATLT